MRIEKKVLSESFERIVNGSKKYELRLADFECKPGDTLVLKEWDSTTRKYTGRILEKTVTFIEKTNSLTYWTKEDSEKYGYQIITFD